MTELVDRVVAAIRLNHDVLVALIPNLGEDQLKAPSGASDWSVAQVLSHLGSSAEINSRPIARAVGLEVAEEDNQVVWARWDAAGPVDQAAGFVEQSRAYVELIEGLTDEQRSSVTVELGFLPEPVPLVVALGLRLNEVANHGWDVRAGLDPSAEVDDESATVLLELFSGPLAFVLGFSGRPGEVDREVRLAVPGGAVVVDDQVRVTAEVTDPTATLAGPRGAAVRLLSGRLKEPYVGGVHVTGDVTLEELRRVFPGY